jgi:hypothetical protein
MHAAQEAAMNWRWAKCSFHLHKAERGAHNKMRETEAIGGGYVADQWWDRMEFAARCIESTLDLEKPLAGMHYEFAQYRDSGADSEHDYESDMIAIEEGIGSIRMREIYSADDALCRIQEYILFLEGKWGERDDQ